MASDTTAKIAAFGNSWTPTITQELTAMYEPLHAAKSQQSSKGVQVQKNVKYGPAARNRLDIYYPNIEENNHATPFHTILFVHSGGFRSGDIDITSSMYGNIGYYFAQKNSVCVLMTYRLLPEACYPSGAEDITMALTWLGAEISHFGGDKNDIVAVGHSAGGAHLASAMLGNWLVDSTLQLKGAVWLSVPLYYDLTKPIRRNNMMLYHRTETEEEVVKKTAVEVLKSASSDGFGAQNLLLLVSEYDTDEIARGYSMFVEEYRRKFHRYPGLEVLKGHNHVTTAFAVGLDDDLLGPRVLAFISQLN